MFRNTSLSATDQRVQISLDGAPLEVNAGDSVAAVLLACPQIWSRLSQVSQSPRAPYCLMGVCFECLVKIDGVPSQLGCQVQVRAGMRIERQLGKREIVL